MQMSKEGVNGKYNLGNGIAGSNIPETFSRNVFVPAQRSYIPIQLSTTPDNLVQINTVKTCEFYELPDVVTTAMIPLPEDVLKISDIGRGPRYFRAVSLDMIFPNSPIRQRIIKTYLKPIPQDLTPYFVAEIPEHIGKKSMSILHPNDHMLEANNDITPSFHLNNHKPITQTKQNLLSERLKSYSPDDKSDLKLRVRKDMMDPLTRERKESIKKWKQDQKRPRMSDIPKDKRDELVINIFEASWEARNTHPTELDSYAYRELNTYSDSSENEHKVRNGIKARILRRLERLGINL